MASDQIPPLPCICRALITHDPTRHFKECPLRTTHPNPPRQLVKVVLESKLTMTDEYCVYVVGVFSNDVEIPPGDYTIVSVHEVQRENLQPAETQ